MGVINICIHKLSFIWMEFLSYFLLLSPFGDAESGGGGHVAPSSCARKSWAVWHWKKVDCKRCSIWRMSRCQTLCIVIWSKGGQPGQGTWKAAGEVEPEGCQGRGHCWAIRCLYTAEHRYSTDWWRILSDPSSSLPGTSHCGLIMCQPLVRRGAECGHWSDWKAFITNITDWVHTCALYLWSPFYKERGSFTEIACDHFRYLNGIRGIVYFYFF